jgi:hypothetical protein
LHYNRDPFAATNNPGTSGLFNEGEENVAKKVGDKIGYIIFRRQEVKVNPGFKFSTGHLMFLFRGCLDIPHLTEKVFSDIIFMQSHLGKAQIKFLNYGLKGQIIYKLNGRNFLIYNGAYFSQAPFLEDIFINPRLNGSLLHLTLKILLSMQMI